MSAADDLHGSWLKLKKWAETAYLPRLYRAHVRMFSATRPTQPTVRDSKEEVQRG